MTFATRNINPAELENSLSTLRSDFFYKENNFYVYSGTCPWYVPRYAILFYTYQIIKHKIVSNNNLPNVCCVYTKFLDTNLFIEESTDEILRLHFGASCMLIVRELLDSTHLPPGQSRKHDIVFSISIRWKIHDIHNTRYELKRTRICSQKFEIGLFSGDNASHILNYLSTLMESCWCKPN